MKDHLDRVGSQALKEIEVATSLESLEAIRLAVLGKKGSISEVLKGLATIAAVERPIIGAVANQLKNQIDAAVGRRKSVLEDAVLADQLKNERIDVTAPARLPHRGASHPITQVTRKMVQILSRLGFNLTFGPEAETEYLNFEAVNIPSDHPARDMQDTFFMGPGVVLRTHTSSVQMRAMRSQPLPLRILCPGAVYRCDNDATHSPMFHQLEGLWVDRGVRMSDLKGVLLYLAQELFGSETKIRLRASYFPFVEPGAEVDVSCFHCRKKISPDCRICRGTGWLEILGSGMVHPRLFELAGYEKDEIQDLSGFAFGIGIERISMLLYGIPDLRMLFQSDMRFLMQF